MKTASTGNFRSMVGKIIMGLVLAVMIGNVDVVPALGDDHKRMGKHDNGRYDHRGRGYDHKRYAPPVRRDYGYRPRVYVPPAVVIVPPSPPGIAIFFPPIFIHP